MKVPDIDYKHLRGSIADGMIGGFRTPSTFGWAIRLWTKGRGIEINGEFIELNHVGVFHWDRKELFFLEADKGEVQSNRFSTTYNCRKYKGEIYLLDPCFKKEEERWDMIDRILPHVGKPYNVKDIFKMAFGEKELSNIDKSFYCSALINYGLEFKLTGGKHLNIKPQEVMTRLMKMNSDKKVLKYRILNIGI